MKVSILSTYDRANGSARAAYRLHQGLQEIGLASQMVVQGKQTADANVIAPKSKLAEGLAKARVTFDGLPLKLYRQRKSTLLSLQWLPDRCATQIKHLKPDIINLHWANDAYVQIETLAKLKPPLVWSLHDMWAFTGGCHYTQGCDRYRQACGACPHLGSQTDLDLSRWVWQRKRKTWRRANLTIVALSQWLGDCARESSLLKDIRVEVIPNGIDTQAYKPIDKQTARQLLGLPSDKQLVLFGALKATSDQRKGFHLLQPALRELSQNGWHDRLELVVVGASQPDTPTDFGFKTHYLGTFADDLTLALIYSAADLFVAPSVQENLANTVMEALACGTPCVAFKVGGMPDMIDPYQNGYLAQPFEIEDLAQGIAWVLENTDRHQALAANARETVMQRFTLEIQAHRYATLFEDVIKTTSSP
ncbi:MAG: glycosyltransferase family 4 protein [Cyanobacteria bacterium P01_A01_bin.114]